MIFLDVVFVTMPYGCLKAHNDDQESILSQSVFLLSQAKFVLTRLTPRYTFLPKICGEFLWP